MSEENEKNPHKKLLGVIAGWITLVGSILITAAFLFGAIINFFRGEWLLEIAKVQFAATIGLPFAALAALCIVFVLEMSSGPIEIEGLGFKFKGAAGPVVLWIFVFLSIVSAIKMLWQ